MKTYKRLAAVGILAFVAGCGGAAGKQALSPEDDSGKKSRTGASVSKAAAENFERALDQFVAHDKAQDWKGGVCESVAKTFIDANDEQKSDTGRQLPESIYNAGLAYQRCGKHKEAQAQFERAISVDGSFHRAKAQLALYDFKRTSDIDRAISELDQIIRDAKFQNVEGLVALAALQMQRGGSTAGAGCADDMACAQLNLQRALAIDDSFMPAFNQLAAYYLEQAKQKAGKKSSRGRRRSMVVSGAKGVDVNQQQLDLAALVASQAQRKNPNYAPIHNTTGLILVELKNFNGAVKAFGRARQLDPSFFEAHMNYAAVSLSFRGFQQAAQAYRDALKLRPKEYEAHLGLALAIRGQINDSNFEKFVKEAQSQLDAAKKIAPERPETYYNEAILFQEFRAKRGKAVNALEEAAKRYQEFINRAGSDAEFAQAVKRSQERVQDIQDMVTFIKEGEEAERQQREAQKEAERIKKEQEAQAKAEKEKAEKEKADEAAGKPAGGTDKAGAKPAGNEKSAPGKPPPTSKTPAGKTPTAKK